MKSKLVVNLKKCATCKYYQSKKKLIMFGKVVEVDSKAPCMKTYSGNIVGLSATCKSYTKDPYL